MLINTRDEMFNAFGQSIPCVFARGFILKVGNQEIVGAPPQMRPIRLCGLEKIDEGATKYTVDGYDDQNVRVRVYVDFG